MCRLLGYVSKLPVSLQTAVGAGFDDFVNLSIKHGDGWGLAHVDTESGEAHAHRLPEAARQSALLKELACNTKSDGATFHLRWATPGLTVRRENTHPFVRGNYAFMHNGAVFTGIDALLPRNLEFSLEGDTDSEKYFFVALEAIDRLGLFAGMTEAVKRISASCEYTSLNAMILSPEELIIACEYRAERIPSTEPDDYYEIRHQVDDNRILVASTGWPQEGWSSLPNHSISRIDRKTLAVSTHPLP